LLAKDNPQFAAAAGATVIATTSSDEKMDLLKSLGAHYVLNYKTDPNWGETAKSLTAGKTGVTNIIEVGGPTSMRQSLAAVKMDGLISVVGFLGGAESASQPSFLDTLMNLCTVRGVIVGSRIQFENMNQAIDATNLKPVVDGTVWNFDQLKDAYQYMWDQKHFGKVVVRISN
jgi:NADPH:quinone reductase-like Zn-dependent oxidoreductase